MDHRHEAGNTALKEDLIPDNLSLLSPSVHLSLVTDRRDIIAQEGQSPIHPSKSDQEPSDIQTEINNTDREHSYTSPESNSNEVSPSECAVDSADEPTPLINLNYAEAQTIVCPQESPLLRARVSPATPPRDKREADLDDRLNSIQILHTELDDAQTAGLALPTDEKTREDFDFHCEDFLHSIPPSSSPPQLFSSSPYASSQSSVGDVEPSKMVLAVGVESCTRLREYVHEDHVVLVAQDDSRLESEDLHNHDTAEIATSPKTDKYCSQMGPASNIEDDLELSRKRIVDPDGSYGSQPTKRPNLDSRLHLPPAPRRATIASQHHQFKKLATPFRPPLKLPAVAEAQTMNSTKVETTMSATLETSHNKINQKRSTIPFQHRASNTSRSIAQFKSPLVNGVLPVDSRTIRLTPALQTLERNLQLLKRAIKVMEDNEEEVLIRLAEKWIEAGREVAYDVWDAIKDTGNFAGKTTTIRRSYGWESTNNSGNTPWGWGTRPGDEESCDLDPSEASCTTRRLAPEEDDDACCNTLGTMLRQLGIAPEILGWDDEKEAFSD